MVAFITFINFITKIKIKIKVRVRVKIWVFGVDWQFDKFIYKHLSGIS